MVILAALGRECVPASLPVVESLSATSKEDNNNEVDTSMIGNIVMEKPKSNSGHAYCHVTSDIPLPSGQPPVVKGIIHLYESVFWGLNVKVKMHDLPIPRSKWRRM